jgi:hypothetical protein
MRVVEVREASAAAVAKVLCEPLDIPLKWFAEGGGITNNLPNNLQSVWIYSNGTMRIQKNGVTWERDVDGTCRTITE